MKTALLIVDVQHDFLPPSGSLAVPDGEAVLPVIVRLLDTRAFNWGLVVASKDWHPAGHISFATSHPPHRAFEQIDVTNAHKASWTQTLWPEHCIQHTHGSEIHPEIADVLKERRLNDQATIVVEKGADIQVEAYSAFDGQEPAADKSLAESLKDANVDKVVVVGLATDYCVRASALSSIQHGFKTAVIAAGARAVGGQQAAAKVCAELEAQGGFVINGDDWEKPLRLWMQ